MAVFRFALVAAAATALLAPISVKAAETTFDVEYLGGSVTSIPVKTFGTLNLKDRNELRFWYATEVESIPYTQITGSQLAKPEGGKHLFGHVPVPSLPHRRYETLSINYHDEAGKENTVKFQLTPKEAEMAKDLLANRLEHPSDTKSEAAGDEWWGDRYWKTDRNRSKWESQTASANK